jgi:tetratricopeptide (TPR) repeat protein
LQAIPVLMTAFSASIQDGTWPTSLAVPPDAEEQLDVWPLGMVTVMRAATAFNRGDVAELGETSDAALRLFERNGDLWGLAIAMQLRSDWLILDGQLERALHMTDEATRLLGQITSAWDLQQQQGSSVGILLRLGRVDEAIERSERQLAHARETGSSRALTIAEASAAGLHLALDDAEAALPHLRALEAAIQEWPDVPLQLVAMTDASRAGYARLHGDLDAATAFMRAAADAAVASDDHPVMAAIALGVGLIALDRGEPAEARRALDLAVSLRGAPDPLDPPEARLRSVLGLTPAGPVPALAAGAGSTGTGLDRDQAAEALTQILRR